MICKQCKQDLPQRQFWPFKDEKPKGYKVKICGNCAHENMVRWARTQNVGKLPDEVDEVE